MRTTFDIDEKLLEQARELAQVRTKREAVELALREFIRKRRIERIKNSLGTDRVDMTLSDLIRMRKAWTNR